MQYRKFTFNPFAVNTYVVWDETGSCAIVDPGMAAPDESEQLFNFVETTGLKPELVLLTHCHLDHIAGWKDVYKRWGLLPQFNVADGEACRRQNLEFLRMLGLDWEPVPRAGKNLIGGDQIRFGNSVWQVLDTPGHSAASISFFHAPSRLLISGDVLFYQSIGRTDLDGGDFDVLSRTLRQIVYPLGDEVKVLPGHMNETYIGYERKHNPFVRG
ncbi:MAG: MBL fold metallo-hydrolase [Bacteroidia bacterium]|nr:MBL fold metallo-hydrolase [Bacteroidia bacterium]MDW8334865.1 MBL fold metallo-hydrolase [Bacteroidia bacterium]